MMKPRYFEDYNNPDWRFWGHLGDYDLYLCKQQYRVLLVWGTRPFTKAKLWLADIPEAGAGFPGLQAWYEMGGHKL